jgi:hypothetical protein
MLRLRGKHLEDIAMRFTTAAILSAALIAPALGAERCLIADQIDGFSDATRDSVILSAHGRNFRVEFAGPCIGLDSAITVASVAATTCFTPGDKLRFEDGTGFPQICIARAVTYLPKDSEKDAKTAP